MVEKKPQVTVNVSAVKAVKDTNEKVEIVTKETFKIMFGDRWYFFKKGEPVTVSKEMKNYLNKQGALAVI